MTDRFLLRGALAVLAASGLAFALRGYSSSLLTWIAIAAVLASSLRFVLLIGELNFAVAAFFGLGAYAAGAASTLWNAPFVLALLAGGVVAVAASAVFGFVTLRVRGPYFLLIGFAFTEVMRIAYTRSAWLGGNSGMIGIFPPDWLAPYYSPFAVALSTVLIVGLAFVERAQAGRLFTAVRDNENVVRSVGIRVHRVKMACFCIASFAAGIAGATQAFANNVISPPDFGFLLSTFALGYVKVGGEDHPFGPVLGALLLVLLASWAQSMGGGELIFYGAAIVISVIFMPGGVVGLVRRWMDRRRPMALARPRQAVR